MIQSTKNIKVLDAGLGIIETTHQTRKPEAWDEAMKGRFEPIICTETIRLGLVTHVGEAHEDSDVLVNACEIGYSGGNDTLYLWVQVPYQEMRDMWLAWLRQKGAE